MNIERNFEATLWRHRWRHHHKKLFRHNLGRSFHIWGQIEHTGKPNSPFSAKHHPFYAQTTRSRHTIPVLGLILPFTAQSHPPFSVYFDGSPTCAACYKIELQSWAPVRVWRDLPNRIMRQVQKWPWFIIKIKIFNYMHILSGSYLNFQRFRRIRLWFW